MHHDILLRILRERYAIPTLERYHPTWHAVNRAKERWMLDTDKAALKAIWKVIRQGKIVGSHKDCVQIRLGTRTCIVTLDGAIVTVWIHEMSQQKAKTRRAYQDYRERVLNDVRR